MFPRRRVLSLVFILLSLNGDLVFVVSLGVESAINVQPVTECYPSSESPQLVTTILTVPPNGITTEFVPVQQGTCPGSQQLISNEVLTYGSYPQGVAINNGSPLNYAVPYTNSLTYLTPVVPNSLQLVQPTTEVLAEVCTTNAPQMETLTVVGQNYSPVTQTIRVAPMANVPDLYQTPINVQIPSMPQLSPFIAVATPLPEMLQSQTIGQEICKPKIVPKIYPQSVDIGIETVASVPIKATGLGVQPSDNGCYGSGLQSPITLQINMPSSSVPEPVVVGSSQPQPFSSSQYPLFGTSPYPVVIMERSRSKWKNILPILLLMLFDGDSGNSGAGNCCQCRSNTPYPFPIPIPINNPIITGSCKDNA